MEEKRTPTNKAAGGFLNAYKYTRSDRADHAISIRLSDELVTEMQKVGNQEGLSQSDTIRLLIRRGLTATYNKQEDNFKASTIEGLKSLLTSLEENE